jgi:acetyl-CoA C-acetyltransferase
MHDHTPVLIGAGQFTYRGDALAAPTPLDLVAVAAERAARDAGLDPSALSRIDALGVVGFTIDAPGGLERLPFPRLKNPPKSLAKRLGAHPRHAVYSHMGGNSPQQMVNHLCEKIARGMVAASTRTRSASAPFLRPSPRWRRAIPKPGFPSSVRRTT